MQLYVGLFLLILLYLEVFIVWHIIAQNISFLCGFDDMLFILSVPIRQTLKKVFDIVLDVMIEEGVLVNSFVDLQLKLLLLGQVIGIKCLISDVFFFRVNVEYPLNRVDVLLLEVLLLVLRFSRILFLEILLWEDLDEFFIKFLPEHVSLA